MAGPYDNRRDVDAAIMAGRHRALVGGRWDEIGQLQLDFLRAQGMRPHHKLLDIGCGSLRAGVKLIKYLDPGHYFGTDIHESLLSVGYDIELAKEGLQPKLPRSQLIVDGEFDFSWCRARFDFALAQSVFTHLPLERLRGCLERLAGAMQDGGRFFMTIYEIPDGRAPEQPLRHEPGGIVSHAGKDPWHFGFAEVADCARGLPWSARYIGEWGHPRSQKMIAFARAART